jgi:cyclic pyranopterin phosphate synthase
MIDVNSKFNTLRYAKAEGWIITDAEVIDRVKNKTIPKGDVLEISRAAGISSAKKTSEIIIFCHPVPVDWISVSYELFKDKIKVTSEVKAVWKTGVEMEAVTAVSSSILNIYDMLKPLTNNLVITDIKVVEKKGGKSDFKNELNKKINAAVLVISDSTYKKEREDKSGRIIKEFLNHNSIIVKFHEVFPDNKEKIKLRLLELCDKEKIDLIFTTGGTGLGPKDFTPETTADVVVKQIPGIAEAIRKYGNDRTPFAMLSREIAGIRNQSIIINLPGSSRGVMESLNALFPGVLHAFLMMQGGGHNNSL